MLGLGGALRHYALNTAISKLALSSLQCCLHTTLPVELPAEEYPQLTLRVKIHSEIWFSNAPLEDVPNPRPPVLGPDVSGHFVPTIATKQLTHKTQDILPVQT